MEKHFKLVPDAFKDVRRKILLRSIPLMLIGASAGIYISMMNSSSRITFWEIAPFVVPLMLFAGGVGLYIALRTQKRMWNSYELLVNEKLITRTQSNLPPVSISWSATTEILEFSSGALLITDKVNQKARMISVPSAVNDRQVLLDALRNFAEIKQAPDRTKNKVMLVVIAVLVAMVVFFTSINPIVVLVVGSFLLVALIGSIYAIQKSSLLDSRTKLSSLMGILVVLSIIFRMLYMLRMIPSLS